MYGLKNMGCIHFKALVSIFEPMNVYIAENRRKHIELGEVALAGDKVFIL